MIEFLKGVWTSLLALFSGCGNIIFEKLLKKDKSKKHNKESKSFSDKEIILNAIERSNDFCQKEIFMRFFINIKITFLQMMLKI